MLAEWKIAGKTMRKFLYWIQFALTQVRPRRAFDNQNGWHSHEAMGVSHPQKLD